MFLSICCVLLNGCEKRLDGSSKERYEQSVFELKESINNTHEELRTDFYNGLSVKKEHCPQQKPFDYHCFHDLSATDLIVIGMQERISNLQHEISQAKVDKEAVERLIDTVQNSLQKGMSNAKEMLKGGEVTRKELTTNDDKEQVVKVTFRNWRQGPDSIIVKMLDMETGHILSQCVVSPFYRDEVSCDFQIERNTFVTERLITQQTSFTFEFENGGAQYNSWEESVLKVRDELHKKQHSLSERIKRGNKLQSKCMAFLEMVTNNNARDIAVYECTEHINQPL
ncbi:MAG: hypothetical protein HYV16_12985 [Gammaproteobacteria bacterium]|nr:hypothetical protein [Gammaproteobacteria bacterium]